MSQPRRGERRRTGVMQRDGEQRRWPSGGKGDVAVGPAQFVVDCPQEQAQRKQQQQVLSARSVVLFIECECAVTLVRSDVLEGTQIVILLKMAFFTSKLAFFARIGGNILRAKAA